MKLSKKDKKSISNLKQYVAEDMFYNSSRKNLSDFEVFCVNHCTDIVNILDLVRRLSEQSKIE